MHILGECTAGRKCQNASASQNVVTGYSPPTFSRPGIIRITHLGIGWENNAIARRDRASETRKKWGDKRKKISIK